MVLDVVYIEIFVNKIDKKKKQCFSSREPNLLTVSSRLPDLHPFTGTSLWQSVKLPYR